MRLPLSVVFLAVYLVVFLNAAKVPAPAPGQTSSNTHALSSQERHRRRSAEETASEAATKTVTLKCPKGFHIVRTSCYHVSAPVNGSEADAVCRRAGGVPAIIESDEEMNLLKDSVFSSTVYLGMTSSLYKENYIAFQLKMTGHSGYTNFRNVQPSGCDDGACVTADSASEFAWTEAPCTEIHPVLCKAPIEVLDTSASDCEKSLSCPAGTHQHKSSCFWVDGRYSYAWADAQKKCRARNMLIASVHSQQENDFIKSLAPDRELWLGLNDRKNEDEFVWTDGTLVDFQNWFTGEPNDHLGTEDCVLMRSYADGRWNDGGCYGQLGVACRAPAQ